MASTHPCELSERLTAYCADVIQVRAGNGAHADHRQMFVAPHWIVCDCGARAVASGSQVARARTSPSE